MKNSKRGLIAAIVLILICLVCIYFIMYIKGVHIFTGSEEAAVTNPKIQSSLYSKKSSNATTISTVEIRTTEDAIAILSQLDTRSVLAENVKDIIESSGKAKTTVTKNSKDKTSTSNSRQLLWPKDVSVNILFQGDKPTYIIVETPRCAEKIPVSSLASKKDISKSIVKNLARSGGFCGVISTAHSIIEKLQLPTEVWSNDNGKTISRQFLDRVAAGGNLKPGDAGTTADQEAAMHENFQYAGKRFVCDPVIGPDEDGGSAGFCGVVTARVADGYDCEIGIFRDIENGGSLGHTTNVRSATKSGNSCVLNTVDTSDQGDGTGNNVPAHMNPAEEQTWVVNEKGNLTNTKTPDGDSATLNARKYYRPEVMCCKVVNR